MYYVTEFAKSANFFEKSRENIQNCMKTAHIAEEKLRAGSFTFISGRDFSMIHENGIDFGENPRTWLDKFVNENRMKVILCIQADTSLS
jgi:hypothetical protein